jgi:hypothetical protein
MSRNLVRRHITDVPNASELQPLNGTGMGLCVLPDAGGKFVGVYQRPLQSVLGVGLTRGEAVGVYLAKAFVTTTTATTTTTTATATTTSTTAATAAADGGRTLLLNNNALVEVDAIDAHERELLILLRVVRVQ